ncbi:MAG: hypothetical protein K2G72_07320, partial [Duncaniella sp.]|nr:hypothetical protein [Duncaniella sp.]
MSDYLKVIFSLMLVVYLIVALSMTVSEADTQLCRAFEISVEDSASGNSVVPAGELAREIASLPE